MARAFLFVLDSFGIGCAPDAEAFGDVGANTLGHIAQHCAQGLADRDGIRAGRLVLPNMEKLGLGISAKHACGALPAGFNTDPEMIGRCWHASELSKGKDTPSGHWEIAGVPVRFEWGYFPDTVPCFKQELLDSIYQKANLSGSLANRHASGTQVIEAFGEEHINTGKPIFYTSADSVFQIAAHETHFGLENLYDLCETVREIIDPLNIGRVIARPFVGENEHEFKRTGNRRDYSVPPPEPTLLDRLKEDGRQVIAVGKIADIYAHCGPTDVRKASGNEALFATTLQAIKDSKDGDLVFTNFVDFDMLYGHRRDVAGYAHALESFDQMLPRAMALMQADDLLILTADHGCDPTWEGSDHTREQVPVLAYGSSITPGFGGGITGFTHIGETIAAHLGIEPGKHGHSLLS